MDAIGAEKERRFWHEIHELATQLIGWVDSLPRTYAVEALDAIERSDARGIRQYFRSQFGREPLSEELVAFRKVLGRPGWQSVRGLRLTLYLAKATMLEGRKIRDSWEKDGILTPAKRAREARAARELDRRRTRTDLPPDRLLQRREATEARVRLSGRVCARVRSMGSPRDRAILGQVEEGRHEQVTAMLAELGLPWSAWQSFLRKIERWGKAERENLRTAVSSRRSSAA